MEDVCSTEGPGLLVAGSEWPLRIAMSVGGGVNKACPYGLHSSQVLFGIKQRYSQVLRCRRLHPLTWVHELVDPGFCSGKDAAVYFMWYVDIVDGEEQAAAW